MKKKEKKETKVFKKIWCLRGKEEPSGKTANTTSSSREWPSILGTSVSGRCFVRWSINSFLSCSNSFL